MFKLIKISKMTGKLEGIPAINTSPLHNDFCMKMCKTNSICSKCYSIRMVTTYRQRCNLVWIENGKLLSESIIPDEQLPFINSGFVRFNAHGELLNSTHAINYFNIAKKNSHAQFGLWTKRKDIINKLIKSGYKIPENVNLVYSNPKINKVVDTVPINFHTVFNVITEKNNEVNCGGKKCINCLACYKKNPEKVIIEKLKN